MGLATLFSQAEPTPPTPAPTLTPEQAAAQAETQAASIATTAAATQTSSSATQDTGLTSIYTASVDNLVNTQQAQTVSTMISYDLQTAANSSYSSCSSSSDPLSDPDCYMTATLASMSDLSQSSATSFSGAATISWSNVCIYSSLTCGAGVPNPYAALLPPAPPMSDEEMADMIQELAERGFVINPRTGVITVNGGKVINPSQINSLKKNLGENQTEKLLDKIKSMERSALQKVKSLSRSQLLKALGLSPKGPQYNIGTLATGYSDSAQRGGRRPSSQSPRASIQEQMEGLVTNYRGDPVGVSKDSLFRMIKHRYQVKKSQKSFMTP